jgi:tripartite-type tricarboxylate transporter receptor subunit TctC
MVVPWPPGQATDWVGRVVGQRVGEQFGQQVVPDNRPGAGGAIGTEIAAKASPDGYTLLAASSGPISILPLLQKVPYDYERQFTAVALAGRSPFVLVTAPSFPATNAREFTALARANPGKYTFGSSGTGATAHLFAEWFNISAAIKAVHVPFKGSIAAITEVMTGQVSYTIETLTAVMPQIKAGRLRAYGVTIAAGSPLAPSLQPLATAAEVPGYDMAGWVGIMVPAGTPKAIVDRFAVAVDKAMQAQDTRERLANVGVQADYRPGEAFTRFLIEQKALYADIVKRGNIKID